MNKTVLISFMILCLLSTVFLMGLTFDVQLVRAEPKTWTVDDDGPADFHTMQEAVNNANPGDRIYVKIGNYSENIVVNKSLSLVGEDRNATIIDGGKNGIVLSLIADNVTIENFTVINSHPDLYGIFVNSSNNHIKNNIVAESNYGIYFDRTHNNNVSSNLMFNNLIGHYMTHSDNNTFERNRLTSNVIGFYSVRSDGGVLNKNMIAENEGVAILVMHGHLCTFKRNRLVSNGHGFWLDPVSNCLVLENSIVNNREGGIRSLGYSYDNIIMGNNITGSNDGLLFHDTTNTAILYNTISKNEHGIAIHGGSSISVWLKIKYNNIINNTYGLWQSEYHCAQVSQNNFINNNVQAKNELFGGIQSIIQWNAEYPSGGNYWSDYNGTDLYSGSYQNETGYDWIGDSPYVIDENNQDNYPLIDHYVPEIQETKVVYRNLLGKYNELLFDFDSLNSTYYELLNDYSELQSTYDLLDLTHYELVQNHSSLQEQCNNELNSVRNLMYVFTATTIFLIATTVYLAVKKPKIKP